MINRKNLLIGCFIILQFWSKAQQEDSLEYKINKTDIEFVYKHYLQDGDHSAVTGGTGTEHLIVYGPAVNLKKTKGLNAYSLNVGADVISSASTDKIDFVVSSASILDTRAYMNTAYERNFSKEELRLSGGLGFSLESDYLSLSAKVALLKQDKKNLRSYSLLVQMYHDDLRWGRLDVDYRRPAKLVYPVELRGVDWQQDYLRNSFNLKLGFTQVLNKRNILGVFPEFSYQQGLLSTPFHRVYFSDGTLGIEQLPAERFKLGLALRLNSFVGGRFILKNTINSYLDDFGILAFSVENETIYKLKDFLSLLANARFYTQSASKYFKPFQVHHSSDALHSSDYDLSELQSYTIGVGMKYLTDRSLRKRWKFKALILRYNFLYRSDGLIGHSFSLGFQTELVPEKKTK